MTKAALILAAALAAAAPAGAVIYVDQNACGEGDNGTSWSDAFHSIQMAIDFAAAGADKEIWVADGVYVEAGPVRLRDGVALYGGFTGCSEGEEVERSQRNPTGRSAIIDADGGKHAVMIENVKGVTVDGFLIREAVQAAVYCANSSEISIALNVIVINGTASAHSAAKRPPEGALPPHGWAGGIHCRKSDVSLTHNRVASNGGDTGGILLEESEGKIVGNTIAHNGAASAGGGIACLKSSPAIANNLIVDNRAATGGGVWADAHSKPRLINNTIVANKVEKPDQIGGVLLYSEEALVINCILWGNGVDLQGGTARNCIIQKGGPDADNLRADPLFVNPAKGDYRLKPGSPAIDAGDTAALDKEKYPTDLAGGPRVCDGDGKDGPQVDIGAYEYCPKPE